MRDPSCYSEYEGREVRVGMKEMLWLHFHYCTSPKGGWIGGTVTQALNLPREKKFPKSKKKTHKFKSARY